MAESKAYKVPAGKFESTYGDIKFSDFKGQNIVLYFYPKDNTPGCTSESNDFRDNIKKFDKLNTVILGVSKDNMASHKRFEEKYDLPFALIADEDKRLCEHFDVIKEKSMFGKKYMGIERTTLLIDDKGKVKHEWRKVKVKEHVDDVLMTLAAMG